MTPSTITPVVASDWTGVTSLRYRFGEHAQFLDIHTKFDSAYSYEIIFADDIFTDKELRTSLKPSAIALIRTKIVDTILSEATSTVDTSKILPMFNNLLLSTQDSSGLPYQIRTVANLGNSLDVALALKKPFMIYIDLSRCYLLLFIIL